MQRPPREAGIDWPIGPGRSCAASSWSASGSRPRSSCLHELHRLGFVSKRPKKRLLNAATAERAAFVAEYAALRREA